MAMKHPDARIIGNESDVVGSVRWYQDRVLMHRTPSKRLSIQIQDRKNVPMQMHWMIYAGLVVKLEFDELPLVHHNHSGIGKGLPIQCVGHACATK